LVVPPEASAICEHDATQLSFDHWLPAAEAWDHPATWVSWCNAEAFCLANGKRLCGAIDGGYLEVDNDSSDLAEGDLADAEESEWYRACSGGGTKLYAYGDAFEEGRCVRLPDSLEPVGSRPGCEGGYSGLFDMGGNAGEWVGARSRAGNDRGGGGKTEFDVVARAVSHGIRSCVPHALEAVTTRSGLVAIRCCAEPLDAEEG
jgi:formylglycine-generating enzyme